MAALRSRCGHYIFVLFLLSSSFFPRLISAVADWSSLDVYHTSTHGVVLSANLELDPVVDRVERTDRLGCFVDRLDQLHRLVDDFTTRLDLDDFRST